MLSGALRTVSGGYIDVGRYEDPTQEAAATKEMTRVVERDPQVLASAELVEQVAKAPTQQAAMDMTEEAAALIGVVATAPNPAIFAFQIPSPEEMKKMGRVELKKIFADNAERMFEVGMANNDPFLTMLGSQNRFFAQTVMKIKVSDHIKDALENFAKKAGAVCLAAAAAVAAVAAAAAKKIGELWDKTKPARDKIKQVLQDMAKKIAEVTKPAREAIKAAAKKVGIELEKAGHYIAEKAKAAGIAIGETAQKAGKAISEKAHAAGDYLANTAPGKKIIKAGRDIRGKITAVTAAASAAIGAKLAAKGAKMQETQQKYKKAVQKVELLHAAKKLRRAAEEAKKLPNAGKIAVHDTHKKDRSQGK
jgi:hypothetical protein